MTQHNELRLLPWSTPDGKPCYLSTDENGGPLTRLADRTEAAQLAAGAELLEHAGEALSDDQTEPDDLFLLAEDLTGALRDVLRIAMSRGHRLPMPGISIHRRSEGSRLPVAAFE